MNEADRKPVPFEELISGEDGEGTGVLWAINRVLFHPRGFALTVQIGDDGKAEGWYLQGDGTEAWTMGGADEDALMRAFEVFLDKHRPGRPA